MPRLTDRQVRAILKAHTQPPHTSVPKLAARYGVSEQTVWKIIWGRSHKRVTQGVNTSIAATQRQQRIDVLRRVYAETGNKAEAARAAGLTWQAAHYHLKKDNAA
jgi:hypothetical protein